MEKQLDNISDEALKDLDQIFDAVMVRKVVDNADEHHSILKQQLTEVKKGIYGQLEYLEKIDPILELLGCIPKAVVDETNNSEDFQDKKGKYTISSLLTGTALVGIENNQKIKVLEKNIGTYKTKDTDGKLISKSLTELLLNQHDDEISILEEISMLIRKNSETTKSFNVEYMDSIDEQVEILKTNRLEVSKLIEDSILSLRNDIGQISKELTQVKNSYEEEYRLNQEHWQSVERLIEKKSKVSLVLSTIASVGIGISIVLQLI